MIFRYALFEEHPIKARTTEQGRVYDTPLGQFQSVTTVISKKLKSPKLDDWKRNVGKERAKRIVTHSQFKGNSVHTICEQYLLGNEIEAMPTNMARFLGIKEILDQSINTVFGVEFPLYSGTLQAAGRTDGLVEWLRHNVVLDFKTARKPLKKDDDRVFKYNLQTTAYAMMAEEMYSVLFPHNVLIVITEDEPQVIIKTNKKYRDIVTQIFHK